MADAEVLGTSFTRGTGSSAVPVDISGPPIGAWVVISLMASLATATFTAPAGWEVLKTIETTGTRRNIAWGKVKEFGDGATATFTPSASTATTFGVAWGTGKWADRVIGASRARNTIGSSPRTTNIAPSVAATAGSVAVAFSHEATTAQLAPDENTAASPAGWTRDRWVEQVTGNIETIAIYSKQMASAGASGDLTLTYSSAQDNNGWAWQIAIPADDPPPAPTRGFVTVGEMLATPGATWAHRGGSAVPGWPEMSEYAYDQAVLAGYPVLEFSAHRTSDGVWVGSHDPSLNRTSQTTGLPNISSMTWSQVQGYMNTLNSLGTSRAYYRLDDFLDKFTPTHVCVVDPKSDFQQTTEFLNLLDAHGGPTKIVVKFFGAGSGSTAFADAAAARKYRSWGYFYEADFTDGDLAADQSHWTILGMNYDASAPAWAAVTSYGKPVTAHIVPDQAAYDLAMSRGARMAQVSGVTSVAPVGPANGGVAEGSSTVSGGAAGSKPSKGSAVGAVSSTGSAVGRSAKQGTAAGSSTVTGAAVGKAVRKGTAAGSSSTTGSGFGGSGHRGTAAGASAVSGTAAGTSSRRGTASGSVSSTGAAVGRKAPIGTATGGSASSGSAVGRRVSQGTAAAEIPVTGAATGTRVSRGTATGTSTTSGIARGQGAAGGSASGSSTVSGGAAGGRMSLGAAVGGAIATGAAVGKSPNAGTATGGMAVGGSAAGSRPAGGLAVGGLVVSGFARSNGARSGSAVGLSIVSGSGTSGGTNSGRAIGLVAVDGGAAGSAPARRPFPSSGRLVSLTPRRTLRSEDAGLRPVAGA